MLDNNEAIQKEIVSYLSACLDISISDIDCSGGDISKDDKNLKMIQNILNILIHSEEMDQDKNTQ